MQSLTRRLFVKALSGKTVGAAPVYVLDFSFLRRLLTSERVALPPFLRWPVRFLSRQRIKVPSFLGKKGAWGLVAAALLGGLIWGGHVNAMTGYATAVLGLKVQEIKITGQIEASESQIIRKLDLDKSSSLILFDADKARAELRAMPWVEDVSIRKIYPGRIEVAILEHEPLALWQSGRAVFVLDVKGRMIEPLQDAKFSSLILLVGKKADEKGPAFLQMLSDFESVEKQVRAAVFVAGRRWNLLLENGVEIKLPEEGAEKALARLEVLQVRHKIFERDIASLDMRLEGQMSVGLTKMGMSSFQERLSSVKAAEAS